MNYSREIYMAERLQAGDQAVFKEIFDEHYALLCHVAYRYLNDADQAEEVVQDLFVRLWEKRAGLTIETSLRSYLLRAVRNQCLNLIQHEKIKQQHQVKIRETLQIADDTDDEGLDAELTLRIEKAIGSMPSKRREIFRLSRSEGLKYREIAERLHLSIKTVETQMGLAFKHLRKNLQNFMISFF